MAMTARRVRAVLAAAVLAMCSSGSKSHLAALADNDNADVLFNVNGEAFTRSDLVYRELWNLQQGVSTPLPQTIVNVVTMLVVAQHGRTLGFAMTDQQFDDLVSAQIASNHLASQEQWRAALQSLGVGPLAEFRREKEREMIIQRVQRAEMIDNVAVTDDEALAYYRQRNGPSAANPSAQALAEIKRTAVTESRQRAWDVFAQRLRSEARLEWPIPMLRRAYEDGLARMATQQPAK